MTSLHLLASCTSKTLRHMPHAGAEHMMATEEGSRQIIVPSVLGDSFSEILATGAWKGPRKRLHFIAIFKQPGSLLSPAHSLGTPMFTYPKAVFVTEPTAEPPRGAVGAQHLLVTFALT